MVSRITGSVGKGLAAITMDKEYQQKRREEMNRPPKDFGESLAKGGKGLLKVEVDLITYHYHVHSNKRSQRFKETKKVLEDLSGNERASVACLHSMFHQDQTDDVILR